VKLLKIVTFGIMGMSFSVLSAGNFTASILEVGVTLNGNYAYINISPAENVSTCAKHTQVRFELDSDAKRSALSLVLAAQMSGKKIRIYFSDDDCLGDSPRPSTITVVN